jgi:hypothetical protein
MFRFQNIKSTFGIFSYNANYINSFQIVNLAKHDIYPQYNQHLRKNCPTNILVSSGKLLVNIHDSKKNNKISLYAEKNNLTKCCQDSEFFLTNKPYILTIAPSMLYSFYSYNHDTIFQMFLKSDDNIKYYTFIKNKCYISNIEYLN